jgi:hypothetical protein
MALLVERHSKTKDDEESLCRVSSFVPLGSVIVVWIERCDTETAKMRTNSYYPCRAVYRQLNLHAELGWLESILERFDGDLVSVCLFGPLFLDTVEGRGKTKTVDL